MNREAAQSLNALGHSLVEAGHNLVSFTNAIFAEVDKPEHPRSSGSGPDKYSQSAKDARQYTILSLFAPLDPASCEAIGWDRPGSVTGVALANGYTSRSVGALLMKDGLLEWVVPQETVTITERGRIRFREVEARRIGKGSPLAGCGRCHQV